jgi:hypothetical protein
MEHSVSVLVFVLLVVTVFTPEFLFSGFAVSLLLNKQGAM